MKRRPIKVETLRIVVVFKMLFTYISPSKHGGAKSGPIARANSCLGNKLVEKFVLHTYIHTQTVFEYLHTFCCSVDGLLGYEAETFLRRLGDCLSRSTVVLLS